MMPNNSYKVDQLLDKGIVLPFSSDTNINSSINTQYEPNQTDIDDSAQTAVDKEYLRNILYWNAYYKYMASKSNKEADNMDDNKILEMYIQKTNQDQEQLRNDVRASEERTSSRTNAIEERMDHRLDRIENMISTSQDRLEDKIDNNNKFIHSITYANLGIAVAVIALIITIIFK